MNKFIKSAALLLCLTVLFCGCKGNGGESSSGNNSGSGQTEKLQNDAVYESTFRLAYASTDSLNPYLAESKQNKELSTLLFDSLFTIDSSYNLIYRLGSSVEISDVYCVVYLNTSAYFTDGAPVTAADVEASFNSAKNSGTAGYRDELENIVSCSSISDYAVTFQLKTYDENAAYCLTFPIYRAGSENQKDSAGVYKVPVGSGRYIYTNKNGEAYLYKNPNWTFGNVRTEKLFLENLPNDEAVKYCLESGKINCFYDDLSDEAQQAANGSEALYLPLNNLVFIGANFSREITANPDFRKFISSITDREDAAKNEYLGRASAAKGVYNSAWEQAEQKMKLNTTQSRNNADEYAGSVFGSFQKDGEGYYIREDGTRIEITVLVNSENSCRMLFARSLVSTVNSYGIHCTLSSVGRSEYESALDSGSYDLYIGEMKTAQDFNLTRLLTVYGTPKSTESLSCFKKYRAGAITLTEFIDNFENELPVIPVCFRNGAMMVPKSLTGDMNPSFADVYFNIHNCYFTS